MFQKACQIDLGENLKSSDEGIHAASLGGIWQCCVLGYAGVRLCGDVLRIAPNLPDKWNSVTVKIRWQDSLLQLTATHTDATVKVLEGNGNIPILTDNGVLTLNNELNWKL